MLFTAITTQLQQQLKKLTIYSLVIAPTSHEICKIESNTFNPRNRWLEKVQENNIKRNIT